MTWKLSGFWKSVTEWVQCKSLSFSLNQSVRVIVIPHCNDGSHQSIVWAIVHCIYVWYKYIDVANYVYVGNCFMNNGILCSHVRQSLQNDNFFSDFAKCIFSLWVYGRPLFPLVWFLTRTLQLTSWFCESGSASFLLRMTPAHKGHTYPIKCHIACKTEKKFYPMTQIKSSTYHF